MFRTRAETEAALNELEADLPRMIEDEKKAYLMDEVFGLAEVIEERAAPVDRPDVRNRVQCMLRDAGLIPGDDEPGAE